eukprot:scaffold51577_cov42-Phaeocystis_antarctica.AAC.1
MLAPFASSNTSLCAGLWARVEEQNWLGLLLGLGPRFRLGLTARRLVDEGSIGQQGVALEQAGAPWLGLGSGS